MTLSKRKICFTANYVHPEFIERAALTTNVSNGSSAHFEDLQMAELTGVMSQIGHLAAYSMELLDGLYRISQETRDRIERVSSRTAKLGQTLDTIEEKVREGENYGNPRTRPLTTPPPHLRIPPRSVRI